jgi:hypothetical protein
MGGIKLNTTKGKLKEKQCIDNIGKPIFQSLLIFYLPLLSLLAVC